MTAVCPHFNHYVTVLFRCHWLWNRGKRQNLPSSVRFTHSGARSHHQAARIHMCRPLHRETKKPATVKWIKTLLREELYHSPAGSWKVDGEQQQLLETHLSGILFSFQTRGLKLSPGFLCTETRIGPRTRIIIFQSCKPGISPTASWNLSGFLGVLSMKSRVFLGIPQSVPNQSNFYCSEMKAKWTVNSAGQWACGRASCWPRDGGGRWSHSVITARCFGSRKCWGNETVHIWFSERHPSQPALKVPCNWDKSSTLPLLSRGQTRYNWNSPKEGILLQWRENEEMFWLFLIQHLFQTTHILFIQQIFLFNENTK